MRSSVWSVFLIVFYKKNLRYVLYNILNKNNLWDRFLQYLQEKSKQTFFLIKYWYSKNRSFGSLTIWIVWSKAWNISVSNNFKSQPVFSFPFLFLLLTSLVVSGMNKKIKTLENLILNFSRNNVERKNEKKKYCASSEKFASVSRLRGTKGWQTPFFRSPFTVHFWIGMRSSRSWEEIGIYILLMYKKFNQSNF